MFIDACYAHCQAGTQETWLRDDSPVIAKTVSTLHRIITLQVGVNRGQLRLVLISSFNGHFSAVNSKGSWGLVLREESLAEDGLRLPLQPDLP